MSMKNDSLTTLVTISEAGKILGVCTGTLRNWDNSGKLPAMRHPINGYRMYNRNNLNKLLNLLQDETAQSQLPDDSKLLDDEILDNIKLEMNYVHHMDCIIGLKNTPTNSIDIVIADPPYNLSKGGNWSWDNSVDLPGFGGKWSKTKHDWDNMPLADHLRATLSWLAEVKRVVKPTGSVWVFGTYHNIGIINFAMQLLEIEIINEVAWYKRNSFPNLSGRRLTASHETILWSHTGGNKRSYFFDYDKSKELEFPEDNIKKSGKQMRTVWDIPNNKMPEELEWKEHFDVRIKTQKPLRILSRILEISSTKNQVLLVPFAGVGSECVAAAEYGLSFIAFELEKEYVDVCNYRLRSVNAGSTEQVEYQKKLGKEFRGHKEDEKELQTKLETL